MPPIRIKFNSGENTSRDSSLLGSGELVQSVGAEYRIGDPDRIWKIYGRTEFDEQPNPPGAVKIRGMKVCKFDSGGTDQLVVLAGSVLTSATPGDTGTLALLSSSRGADGETLSAAHYNNTWFLATGDARNVVLESDGTVRSMGLIAPPEPPTAVANDGTTLSTVRAGSIASSNGWSNVANTIDSDEATFGFAQLEDTGTSVITSAVYGAQTGSNRTMVIKWRLSGVQFDIDGEPSDQNSGFIVTVKMEKFDDTVADGTADSWVTIFNTRFLTSTSGIQLLQEPIEATNSNEVKFRVTLTYVGGTSSASLRLYDAKIVSGSATTPFNASTGLRWAITEYNESRNIESPPSEFTELLVFVSASSHNQAVLTLPTKHNSEATHFRIYRVPENGVAPFQAGLVGTIRAGNTQYFDTFEVVAETDQPLPIVKLKIINIQGSLLPFPRDTPPPQFDFITAFDGVLIGMKGRFYYWNEPGLPESWPEINSDTVNTAERDELMTGHSLGGELVIISKDTVHTIKRVPRLENGQLISPQKRQISGVPGTPSRQGSTVISSNGTPLVAWVSPVGIYVTNGRSVARITDDADWASNVDAGSLNTCVLEWNQDTEQLIFAYDSDAGGTNDKYALIHMNGETSRSTWGHPASIACLAIGYVGGVLKIYSGHNANGKVYLERNTFKDNSLAHNSDGDIPFTVKTGKIEPDSLGVNVQRGTLRHTDAGTGETMSVTVAVTRDRDGGSQSLVETVRIDGDKGHDFNVNRSGQRFQITLSHTGQVEFAIRDVRIDADLQDPSEAGE